MLLGNTAYGQHDTARAQLKIFDVSDVSIGKLHPKSVIVSMHYHDSSITIQGDTMQAIRMMFERIEVLSNELIKYQELHIAARNVLTWYKLDKLGEIVKSGGYVNKNTIPGWYEGYRTALKEYRKQYSEAFQITKQ